MAKCDGLQYPCENEATHLVVLALEPEATPAIKGFDLCDECYAIWQSWEDDDAANDGDTFEKLQQDMANYAAALADAPAYPGALDTRA
jgi:hypothetical protein